MKIGFTVLICLFASDVSIAVDYYVSASGSDKNPGTEALPFRNPQAAVHIVNPGDTVYIKNGTYPASTTRKRVLSLSRSGTPGNIITFRNYPGHRPQIGRLPATTADQYGFVLEGADYVRIEGLMFVGAEHACFHIGKGKGGGASNVEIVGNTFDQCGRAYKGCGGNSGHNAIYSGPHTNGTRIENNIFSNSGRVIDPACDSLSSSQNHQYRHDHALYLKGKGHIFRNNVVLDYPAGLGIKIDGYDRALGKTGVPDFSHVIVNNTFGSNTSVQPYDRVAGAPIGAYNSTPNSYNPRWLIANNIFINPVRQQSAEPTAVFIRDNAKQNFTTDNICRNNIVTGSYAVAVCGENIANVEPNVRHGGNVLGETRTNLDFVSATSGNYRIGASSSAIGLGDSTVAPPKDFDGKPRGAQDGNVDVGAYQFSSHTSRKSSAAPKPPTIGILESR